MPEFRALLYHPQKNTVQQGGRELIDAWQGSPGSLIWLDIAGTPDEAETRLLTERFTIPRLAIQDAQRDRHPPKLEIFGSFVFMMLQTLLYQEPAVQRAE